MPTLILPCAKGCEQVLVQEAQMLGLKNMTSATAVIYGEGDLITAYRLCLWSRVASRVLWVLSSAPVNSPQALYDHVYAIDWDEHISPDNTISVHFHGSGCGINNSQFGAFKVKDAIVDKLRKIYHRRPNVDIKNPDINVAVHLNGDGILTVSLDLAGHSLHKRCYRYSSGEAPIKETLAATVLYRAKWPEYMHKAHCIIDPMCGSGTLLLEALMMVTDSAPGLLRTQFGFEKWQNHRPALWKKLLNEAVERQHIGIQSQSLTLCGYDANAAAIQSAQNNFARLNIPAKFQAAQKDLREFRYMLPYGEVGMIICNPPYGARLGALSELLPHYAALGQAFKTFPSDWKMTIIAADTRLIQHMRLKSTKQYVAFNGAIKTHIILYDRKSQPESQSELYAPNSVDQITMFTNRLRKNMLLLKKWLSKTDIDAYRVYDRDMPEYAVAIDFYAGWVLVQEYAAPKTINPKTAERRLLDVLQVLPEILLVPPENIVLKTRVRQSGNLQYQKQDSQNRFIIVNEYDAQFYINLHDYLDTGLFLDHRPLRQLIRKQSANKHILNLFCYTASASVQAALGGASSTTNVDLSNTYLDWAQRNFALNQITGKNTLHCSDVMRWLSTCQDQYDIIFCDPPTFSNTKKIRRVFSIQRDHVHLIRQCMRCLSEEGALFFSTNYRDFHLDTSALAPFDIRDINNKTIDVDFKRTPHIHRVWKISNKR